MDRYPIHKIVLTNIVKLNRPIISRKLFLRTKPEDLTERQYMKGLSKLKVFVDFLEFEFEGGKIQNIHILETKESQKQFSFLKNYRKRTANLTKSRRQEKGVLQSVCSFFVNLFC